MGCRKQRVSLDVRGRYVHHCVAKVVFAVWGEKRWSHREFVILVHFGEKRECFQKMLPCEEIARCRSEIMHCRRHSQFWGWYKVVPVSGVLNSSNSYSIGNPWSKRNRRKGSINYRLLPSLCRCCCCCCYGRADSETSALNEVVQPKRKCLTASRICAAQKDGSGWIG